MNEKKPEWKTLDDKQLALVTGGNNTEPLPWKKKPVSPQDNGSQPLPW